MLLVLTLTASSTRAEGVEPGSDLDRALKATAKLQKCRGDLERDVTVCEAKAVVMREKVTMAADTRLHGAVLAGERRLAGCRAETIEVEKALEAAEGLATREWYEAPSLWFWAGASAGMIAGLALAVGAVWGVSQLTEQPLRPAVP